MKSLKVLLAVCLIAGVAMPDVAEAKKRGGSSSNFMPTAEQKRKAWEQGIKGCRAKYGARLWEVHIEKYYGMWKTVCYIF